MMRRSLRGRRFVGGMAFAAAGTLATGCQSLENRPLPTVITSANNSAGGRWTGDEAAPSAVVATSRKPPSDEKPEADVAALVDRSLELLDGLRIADTENPTINIALELARDARALERGADALWLPNLTAGGNFRAHSGNLQRSTGAILDVDSHSLYFGSGAGAVGTAPVAFPGVRIFYPLGETLLEPRAARERTSARIADAEAVRNRVLLAVAEAYAEVQRTNAVREILEKGRVDLAEIVRLTEAYAKAGQGREADANRALATAELLAREYYGAVGEAEAAAARLSGLLDLDPTIKLRPPSGAIAPISLIDANSPQDELETRALASRPEVAARSNELAEAATRLRQDQLRPYLPTISAGLSAGGFGGGSNQAGYSFGHFDARTDFDISAAWNLQNLGLGNRARQLRSGSEVAQARAQLTATLDDIRLEVADALAEAKAATLRMELAGGRLATAEEGYRRESTRIREGIGRVIEILDSFRQLVDSRLEAANAAAALNVAQFRLLASVGGMPSIAR